MKELKNSKYLISDGINSSIFSLWLAGRQTDRHTKKSKGYLFIFYSYILNAFYLFSFFFLMFQFIA